MRARLGSPVRAVVLPTGSERPRIQTLEPPTPREGEALVRTLLAGIDGTDEEIVAGQYGEPPDGEEALVLGHECLGEVIEAPPDSALEPGDRVVPLVRHGCGACAPCRAGASDYCETGRYREHGIKGLHGFMREEWTDDAATLVKAPPELGELAVLTEPLSIVVKALEQAEHIQRRLPTVADREAFRGARALVAGTGSLGTLGAFLLRSQGMEVWALDRHSSDTAAARLLASIGVRHVDAREIDLEALGREEGGFDLVVEATGAPQVVFSAVRTLAPNGVMAMLGVPPDKPPFRVEGDAIMREMVLGNQVLFGSVNSNRHHFEAAMEALRSFRSRWGSAVDGILTHRFRPEEAEEAFQASGEDVVKKVMVWHGAEAL